MQEFCFLNGKVLPLGEAKIGLDDIGLLRGYGIYEGITAFGGKPFRFADHWNRFVSGAHILDLNIPVTEDKCEKIIKELLEKNNLVNSGSAAGRAGIRMILTGGKALGGIEYDFETPTFYILAEKWNPQPAEVYENGAKLVTYRHKRELPEYKTTNYIRAVNLQNWRKGEKAAEILYTYDGEVLECSTSNIFLVKNKKVITPDENVLKGITRKVVLELAGDKFETEERPVREEELKSADEVFITSSFKDIVPVTKIDDFAVSNGEVGEVTRGFMAQFKEYVAKYS